MKVSKYNFLKCFLGFPPEERIEKLAENNNNTTKKNIYGYKTNSSSCIKQILYIYQNKERTMNIRGKILIKNIFKFILYFKKF